MWKALGYGTLAYDRAAEVLPPHSHISAGAKHRGATAFTSDLLSAEVQFLTEMCLIEVKAPAMERVG